MSSVTPIDPPLDYSQRVKRARGVRGLTQAQLAELIGVSYASVNRWENGYSRPNNLPWRRILEIERSIDGDAIGDELPAVTEGLSASPDLDFFANPDAVWALAEAHRLAYGHLFNPAFASETALIDPLPHQRLAVYKHMLQQQSPLRRPSLSGTTTTPSADFCTAVREPHCPLSSLSGNTVQTSRGKTASLHRAPAGFTALALDGYGLRDLMLTRPASSAS